MPASVRGIVLATCLVAGGLFPSTQVSAQPDPPRIIVVGDSVTEQAYSYLGGWVAAPGDVVKIAGAGWDVDDAEGPYATAVAEAPPDVTVIALGPNDANPATGGWTLYDIANFNDLFAAAPEGSCVVVVLPRHGAGFPHTWAVELDEARTHIVDLVAPGGALNPPPGRSYVLADWRMTTAPHPAYLAGDGIHITGVDDNAPARARQDTYWDGAGNCPQGGA